MTNKKKIRRNKWLESIGGGVNWAKVNHKRGMAASTGIKSRLTGFVFFFTVSHILCDFFLFLFASFVFVSVFIFLSFLLLLLVDQRTTEDTNEKKNGYLLFIFSFLLYFKHFALSQLLWPYSEKMLVARTYGPTETTEWANLKRW